MRNDIPVFDGRLVFASAQLSFGVSRSFSSSHRHRPHLLVPTFSNTPQPTSVSTPNGEETTSQPSRRRRVDGRRGVRGCTWILVSRSYLSFPVVVLTSFHTRFDLPTLGIDETTHLKDGHAQKRGRRAERFGRTAPRHTTMRVEGRLGGAFVSTLPLTRH